jgi:hypothetical protein
MLAKEEAVSVVVVAAVVIVVDVDPAREAGGAGAGVLLWEKRQESPLRQPFFVWKNWHCWVDMLFCASVCWDGCVCVCVCREMEEGMV